MSSVIWKLLKYCSCLRWHLINKYCLCSITCELQIFLLIFILFISTIASFIGFDFRRILWVKLNDLSIEMLQGFGIAYVSRRLCIIVTWIIRMIFYIQFFLNSDFVFFRIVFILLGWTDAHILILLNLVWIIHRILFAFWFFYELFLINFGVLSIFKLILTVHRRWSQPFSRVKLLLLIFYPDHNCLAF